MSDEKEAEKQFGYGLDAMNLLRQLYARTGTCPWCLEHKHRARCIFTPAEQAYMGAGANEKEVAWEGIRLNPRS
jgi:hypothetical protein